MKRFKSVAISMVVVGGGMAALAQAPEASAGARCYDYNHTHTRPSGWHEDNYRADHYFVGGWPYAYMNGRMYVRERPSYTADYGWQGCPDGMAS